MAGAGEDHYRYLRGYLRRAALKGQMECLECVVGEEDGAQSTQFPSTHAQSPAEAQNPCTAGPSLLRYLSFG